MRQMETAPKAAAAQSAQLIAAVLASGRVTLRLISPRGFEIEEGNTELVAR